MASKLGPEEDSGCFQQTSIDGTLRPETVVVVYLQPSPDSTARRPIISWSLYPHGGPSKAYYDPTPSRLRQGLERIPVFIPG